MGTLHKEIQTQQQILDICTRRRAAAGNVTFQNFSKNCIYFNVNEQI